MTKRRTKKRNARRPAAPAFRLLKQRYELLMGAINEGVYDWNVVDDTIYYSDSVKQAVGLPPKLLKTAADWRNRIHPEDLPRYDAAFVDLFKDRSKRFECDYRYRALDGSWRWARQHGVAVRGANGRVRRVVGATGDITELKDTEQALKQSEERYALATRAATEGIYEWNVETGALFISDRAREVFGLPPGALRDTDWTARIHPDDVAQYRAAIIEHFKGRAPGVECEYRARDAAGDYRWVLDRGQAVRRADGRAIRLIGAEADITQRKQALEQQTATADILKVISSSPAEVQPVFEAILTNALRLCEASFAAVFTYDGEFLQNVAHRHASPEFARFLQGLRARPSRETTTRRCALERRTIHTHDLLNDPEFSPPQAQRNEKVRTALSVPMIRDGVLAGVITLWRPEVRPFTDRQIALVETFAAQAVIAIENVRLFNETREALEQQTATAQILQITACSPSDVQPVFDAIARNAMQLCDGSHCALFRFDGRLQHFAAHCGVDPQTVDLLRRLYPRAPDPTRISGRAILEREVIHLADALSDPNFPGSAESLTSAGNRAVLAVPMLKAGQPIGVIFMVRREPRRFSERQVALLRTFADQAVIAIENVRLFSETKEALEQQKAIAEVLGVVTQLQTDVQPVFEAIGRNAARLCDALFSCVYRFDGELLHLAAIHNLPPAAQELARNMYPMTPDRSQLSGRAVLTGAVQRLEDVAQDGEYASQVAVAGAWRRFLAVPMLREGKPLGVIGVGWPDPGSIPEPQVELLKTFADEAVIAIENVRLFNETREALEQQKATAEILRVISSSPTDTQPVFDAIVAGGLQLFCDAAISIALPDGGQVRAAAVAESDPARAVAWRARFPFPLTREYMHGVAILDCQVLDLPDVRDAPPHLAAGGRNFLASGYRAITIMPMVHAGQAIGALSVVRLAPGPLSGKQLAVLKTFADQAVIAIENVRLFNETKEALEQQTAAGEVLRVISGSIADTGPVFDKILESCERLFAGRIVGLNLVREDGMLHIGAYHGAHREEFERIFPIPLTRESGSGLSIVERRVVHYPDAEGADVPARTRQGCRAIGVKSVIFAPLLWEGRGVGAIFVGRDHVSSFSEKEIALLRTFADQAVIAIQNVRLFNETKEALEQQKASGEVLQAISSSIADTAPVFDKILESCQRLFAGTIVGLNLLGEDNMMRIGAYHGARREQFERIFPVAPGRSIVERRVVHYPDTEHGADVPVQTRDGCRAIGIRSVIFAPVLWEGRALGSIFVGRDRVSTFSEKETALLKTFADQAAIAIENAQLFKEIQDKSRQLEIASRHKSEFLANMSHELRTPLNAIIGFTRIVMRRSQEALEPRQYENLEKILASGQNLLELINTVLDLSKVEAGRVEVRPGEVEVAPVLEQCLRTVEPLVKADAVALVKEFDATLPRMYVDEEKLRQVVINLLANAAKFTAQGCIRLKAEAANGSVAITVADTGIGIAADKLGLVFEEFEQADASSTRVHGGTGLGLTIARRLARLMGGDIDVESTLGTGSRFTLTLPLRYPA